MAYTTPLTEVRQSSHNSEESLYFINVPDDASTGLTGDKSYHMALLLADNNAMESGINAEDQADVTAKLAQHVLTGTQASFSHSGLYLSKDPVCAFEKYIYDHQVLTAKDVTVDIVRLDTWDVTADEPAKFKGIKFSATCEVTSFGGDAQGKLNIEATYTAVSENEAITGTFDKVTGVATLG